MRVSIKSTCLNSSQSMNPSPSVSNLWKAASTLSTIHFIARKYCHWKMLPFAKSAILCTIHFFTMEYCSFLVIILQIWLEYTAFYFYNEMNSFHEICFQNWFENTNFGKKTHLILLTFTSIWACFYLYYLSILLFKIHLMNIIFDIWQFWFFKIHFTLFTCLL